MSGETWYTFYVNTQSNFHASAFYVPQSLTGDTAHLKAIVGDFSYDPTPYPLEHQEYKWIREKSVEAWKASGGWVWTDTDGYIYGKA